MKLFSKFKMLMTVMTVMTIVSLGSILACNEDETDDISNELLDSKLSIEDKNALMFMLEEEKLARDTYEYLDGLYAINQFSNIKLSEQSHVNAISALLDKNEIPYTIQPYGKFENQELQELYNQFVEYGQSNRDNALEVGATIEDLDIVDLQEFIEATSNTSLISVFESLQCGSRNHLRSFVKAIENANEIYEPQFLTLEEYNDIVEDTNEKCGQ